MFQAAVLTQVYRGLKGGITDVAIKTLLHRDEATHNQFLVEINLLRSLSFDRYIVQFYGACLTGQHPMLVLVSNIVSSALCRVVWTIECLFQQLLSVLCCYTG